MAGKKVKIETTEFQKLEINFGSDESHTKNSSAKVSNKIRTTKYTALTWAPLSLLFQFKRAANIYFLIITILTAMPFSPKTVASMAGTFVLVLVFTMLKEAYEDYQRYKQDKELNNKKTHQFNEKTGESKQILWSQVKVGTIIKVEKDNEIPADILCLSSPKEVVYVSTMNLDGETNLKERNLALVDFNEQKLKSLNGRVVCDQPNESLEEWDGNLYSSMLDRTKNCEIKHMLLRGCTLKNTEYVYGLVIYTGAQTKIMQNSKKPPRKISNVMKMMNYMLYTVFLFQIFIIIAFAILSFDWTKTNAAKHSYLNLDSDTSITQIFIQFLVYWVAYSHMIPISLYVIIEMLKLGQSYLVNHDVRMFDVEDGKFALCRNSDLIEELGQVEFIFSDKTGTLTQNKMEFKKCQVNGHVYGRALPDEVHVGMASTAVEKIQSLIKSKDQQSKPLKEFFDFLGVCHTVVCEKDPVTQELNYQASSPDELALVQGARQIGFEMTERTPNTITLVDNVNKSKEIHNVIAEFPFDSTRKRMSLIVFTKGQYWLMTKGADSIILPRVKFNNPQELKQIEKDLYNFACEGLRTLVMAKKQMTEQEYKTFEQNYQKLKTLETSGKEKAEQLNEMFDKMEQGLTYIGSTAIEDKLQDGVPEAIAKLIESNIRMWVLTGDKQETAIEIGKSCKLIQSDMEELILTSETEEEFKNKLNTQISNKGMRQLKKIESLDEAARIQKTMRQRLCIIIDGPTLAYALGSKKIAEDFFQLGLLAASVVCCRVSPKQKADVVGLAKANGKWITLSIGDGANDVSMIMEAHIGVGIRGKEGTQAVRSADYAISQFRFLQRLLLVHGRWGYRRVSAMICFYFYKNIVLVFTEIYFAVFNGYSGQIYFGDWLPMLYNAFWTSWSCLFQYELEQDANDEYSFAHPQLYRAGQKGLYFTFGIFWRQIFFAIFHGAITFFGCQMSIMGPVDNTGMTYPHWFVSGVAFCIIIQIVTYKLLIDSTFWHWIALFVGIFCVILYYATVILGNTDTLSVVFQPQMTGSIWIMFSSQLFWIKLLTLPFIALFPDYTYMLFKRVLFPSPADRVMHVQKKTPGFIYSSQPDFDSSFQLDSPIKKSLKPVNSPQNKITPSPTNGNLTHVSPQINMVQTNLLVSQEYLSPPKQGQGNSVDDLVNTSGFQSTLGKNNDNQSVKYPKERNSILIPRGAPGHFERMK